MKRVRRYVWLLLLSVAFMLSACSSQGNTPEPPKGQATSAAKQEPVTLTFHIEGNASSLADNVVALVQQKYPHITLQVIKHAKGSTIDDLVTSGNIPDIISYSLGGFSKLKEMNMFTDLTPLIKKHNFDLNRLAPGVVDWAKAFSDKGELLLMPFELNNNALFYNKDIFDKFAVPYPKDNMTWPEVVELSKKLSVQENGVQYVGFLFHELNLVYKNQMGLPFVDQKTNRTLINSDKWRDWTEMMGSFYKLPGGFWSSGADKDLFIKDKRLAMRTGPNFMSELADTGVNWDVVSLPHFPGYAAASQMNAPYYLIPPTSRNKDEAFKVIAYMLSDEVQAAMARIGRLPIIKDEKVRGEFGKEVPGVEGKNLSAFYKDVIAKPIPVSDYDGIAKMAMSDVLKVYAQGVKDTNTILKEAEEKVNKAIEDALTLKK